MTDVNEFRVWRLQEQSAKDLHTIRWCCVSVAVAVVLAVGLLYCATLYSCAQYTSAKQQITKMAQEEHEAAIKSLLSR